MNKRIIFCIALLPWLFFSCAEEDVLTEGEKTGQKMKEIADRENVSEAVINPSTTRIAFSIEGQFLVIGSDPVTYLNLNDLIAFEVISERGPTNQTITYFRLTFWVKLVSWHPNGRYIAHAGHDPYIYVYRVADILQFGNDAIPVAHKTWAGDHAEYIDFNADGSFLVSVHQNGLIKLWVWMGEDSGVNARRHDQVKQQQEGEQ